MGSPHGCTHNIWAGRRYCNADLLWLASAYGFMQGAWPFGIIEAIWAGVAVRRWRIRVRVYEYTPFCNGPGDVKSPRVMSRRRAHASVRGRRRGRHTMLSEGTVSLSSYAWFVG